jgi:hypothetical protein
MPHSIQLVHLSGPLHRRATCCIDTSESRSGNAESRVPSCTFGGSKHKRQPLNHPVAAIATRINS